MDIQCRFTMVWTPALAIESRPQGFGSCALLETMLIGLGIARKNNSSAVLNRNHEYGAGTRGMMVPAETDSFFPHLWSVSPLQALLVTAVGLGHSGAEAHGFFWGEANGSSFELHRSGSKTESGRGGHFLSWFSTIDAPLKSVKWIRLAAFIR